jgi:hypothetical protein
MVASPTGLGPCIQYTGHSYGKIEDTMDVVRMGRKGKHVNTLERYHIYKMYKNNLHMNDVYTETHNPIFQIIHERYDR